MALGTQNYESVVTSQLDNKGQVIGEKRSLRKSNRSTQKANIMNNPQNINTSYQGSNSLFVPNTGNAQNLGISGLTAGGQGYATSQVISGGAYQQNIVGGNGQGLPPAQGRGYTNQVSGGGSYQQTVGGGGIQGSGIANSMNYSQSYNQGGNYSTYEESQFYR